MKQLFFFLLLAPFYVFAQNDKTDKNNFELVGKVSGYENGTTVSFLNDQTGAPEKQTTIENGTFTIKGNLAAPAFKVLIFGEHMPAIPIFLENGKISIKGDKVSAENMVISGSKSHSEYTEYITQIKPFIPMFQDPAKRDDTSMATMEKIGGDFIKKYPASYVSPIVLVQLMQLENMPAVKKLFPLLANDVKKTDIGKYIQMQIEESKINALGSIMEDFSQEDTLGNKVSLQSFRGKYVLIDFWASWCRPCRDENPNVVANFNKFNDKNFTVLGISLDQAKPAWLKAIKMDNLAWTQLSDLKGWSNAVAAQFKISSIPQNLLLDPSGKIIGKNLRGEELGRKLEEILVK